MTRVVTVLLAGESPFWECSDCGLSCSFHTPDLDLWSNLVFVYVMEMYMEGHTTTTEALAVTAQLEMGSPTSPVLPCPFNPVAHDLDPNFRLTRFADLKGWGCKVPQAVLTRLLEGLHDGQETVDQVHLAHYMNMPQTKIGKPR